MRPPTSLHEKHIGGPQNFQPPVQNDFCNKIGQAPTLRHRREIALVAIGVVAVASASVILSLVDVAATKPHASFVPAEQS